MNVNANTKLIVLENVNKDQPVHNFKAFYKSLDYLTKHFLISSVEDNDSKVSRHYTICNAMRPDAYMAYLNALKPEVDPDFARFDTNILCPFETDQMAFVIKNYDHPSGLSKKIFSEQQDGRRFEVKGPMGHGL